MESRMKMAFQHVFMVLVTIFVQINCDENTAAMFAKCQDGSDVFNCTGVGFVNVPAEIHVPASVNTLDFSNNQIQNVTFANYTTIGTNIEILLLKNNHIAYLEKNGFIHFTGVKVIDLSRNNIMGVNLHEESFNDLKSLQTLILEHNPMGAIKKDTFNFMELPKLRHLDLSHCGLTSIEEGGLDLHLLQKLDLSWNKLDSFGPDSYTMLSSLRILDLSHNNFKVFDQVPYLPEIRTINLDSNMIQTVNISDQVWLMADSLERLYLRNNDIARFNRDSIPWDLETLVEVKMENNRIQCDCKMRWFRQAEYDFTDKNISVPCQFPVQLRGTNILDVDPDDFTCSAPLWEIILLAGLATVGLVVIIMSFYVICKKKCKRKLTRKPSRSTDKGGNYTAVFTRDDEDVRVSISDDRTLIQNGREFDV